jgi:hypothetical protein
MKLSDNLYQKKVLTNFFFYAMRVIGVLEQIEHGGTGENG